jgi:hypothetical protein
VVGVTGDERRSGTPKIGARARHLILWLKRSRSAGVNEMLALVTVRGVRPSDAAMARTKAGESDR